MYHASVRKSPEAATRQERSPDPPLSGPPGPCSSSSSLVLVGFPTRSSSTSGSVRQSSGMLSTAKPCCRRDEPLGVTVEDRAHLPIDRDRGISVRYLRRSDPYPARRRLTSCDSATANMGTASEARDGGQPARFRAYLRCGILAHGFARARCSGCGYDLLVAWLEEVASAPPP